MSKKVGGLPYEGYTKLIRKITMRARRFQTNKLLQRKQMILQISHEHLATPRKRLIRRKVCNMYNVKDPKTVVLFGFRTKFGGGKTTGFCLIYDNYRSRRRYDYKHRLIRDGLAKKKEGARKPKKETKNKSKNIRGREKKAAPAGGGAPPA
jgi:small subunit ribosomal protein S24e